MHDRPAKTIALGALCALLPMSACAASGSDQPPDLLGTAGNASAAPNGSVVADSGSAAGAPGVPPQAGAGSAQAGAGSAQAGAPAVGAPAGMGGAGAAPPGGSPDAGTNPRPDSGAGATDSGGIPPGECGADPLAMLRALAPADEDLASDYESYLSEEIGTVACATEGSGGARMVTQTIFVPPGTVYDGRGEQLTADVAMMHCDTTEGEQAENQRPYFLLAPGAQLRNVTIRYPGCEGIHMMGDNVLENIVWEDAGEDAASVRSYFPGGSIVIRNSEGHKAADKMFQFNAPCDVRIESFTGSDMGKLVRQNGGTEFELHVDLNTVDVTGVISAVVQSDSPLCFVRHHALSYMFTGTGDKSDRVFRDIPPANVTEY